MNKILFSGLPSLRLSIACLFLWGFSPFSSSADIFGPGVSFLTSDQESNGSWVSGQTRTSHATTEALLALHVLGQGAAARTAAVNFLAASQATDTDDRSRRIEALAAEGRPVAALTTALLSEANSVGGWGLTTEFLPDPLDTALALTALAAAGSPNVPQVVDAFTAYLATNQNADGDWGCVHGGPSDVSCTAQVLIALSRYLSQFSFGSILTSAQNFLKAKINPDGSIGQAGGDSIYITALAARALVESGVNLGTARSSINSFLVGRQEANGSWGNDPLLTAVALRALTLLANIRICGDGILNLPESCDGLDFGGNTCESLGLGTGSLACNADCTLKTSGCTAAAGMTKIGDIRTVFLVQMFAVFVPLS